MQLCCWTNTLPRTVESAQMEQNYEWFTAAWQTRCYYLKYEYEVAQYKSMITSNSNDEKTASFRCVCSVSDCRVQECCGMFWLDVLHNAVSLNLNERELLADKMKPSAAERGHATDSGWNTQAFRVSWEPSRNTRQQWLGEEMKWEQSMKWWWSRSRCNSKLQRHPAASTEWEIHRTCIAGENASGSKSKAPNQWSLNNNIWLLQSFCEITFCSSWFSSWL